VDRSVLLREHENADETNGFMSVDLLQKVSTGWHWLTPEDFTAAGRTRYLWATT